MKENYVFVWTFTQRIQFVNALKKYARDLIIRKSLFIKNAFNAEYVTLFIAIPHRVWNCRGQRITVILFFCVCFFFFFVFFMRSLSFVRPAETLIFTCMLIFFFFFTFFRRFLCIRVSSLTLRPRTVATTVSLRPLITGPPNFTRT